ncbi:MAG: glycosyltransferase family 2 protein [Anaerolineae bacterium]|nr:glycosyltransferase family 2 protein [Anaerolineae bacterium]
MKIFAIIPVHNRKEITRNNLNCLHNQTKNILSVVVVDDGSQDGTSEMILKEYPNVVLLNGDGNLWWTGAMNKGIEYVLNVCEPEDYILALNDDLTIPNDFVDNISNATKMHPNSLIGSVIVDANDKENILSGCTKINWWTAKRSNIDTGKKITSFPKGYSAETSVLTGRGVLIPVTAFRTVGLYNNLHYKQYSDTELTKRAEKAGYKLTISYDSIVYSQPIKTNNIMVNSAYKINDFWKYFFDDHSNTNLKFRFWFAYDTANNFFQGTIFLLCDLARITFHFFKHLKI